MISIQKYLRAGQKSGGNLGAGTRGPMVPDSLGVLFTLCLNLLAEIGSDLAGSEQGAGLADRLAGVAARLDTDLDETRAAEVTEAVRDALMQSRAKAQENAQKTAAEVQHLVGVLNQALRLMAGGGERSVGRLQTIQGALERTSKIRDVDGLRASLGEAVKWIREEAAREQEAAAKDLRDFGNEVAQARERVAGCLEAGLPGRAEAIAAIRRELMQGRGPQTGDGRDGSVCVAVVVIRRMAAIVQRYGPDVVDELFFLLMRERIKTLAPAAVAFRWSSGGAVSVIRSESSTGCADLRAAMDDTNRNPMVHKISLGNRTAVLKIAVSFLVLPGVPGDPDGVVAEIDRFVEVEG